MSGEEEFFKEEELEERIEEELVSWAVRHAFSPPPQLKLEGGAGSRCNQEIVEREKRREETTRITFWLPVNPSQLREVCVLMYELARKHPGFTFRLRIVRLGDLLLLRWLRGRGRIVRLELEAEPPA